jgi:uncharacterized membrane protein YfcA
MTLPTVLLLLGLGVGIGIISGMVGIGGGILVIPVLVFLVGFSQAKANGTSLAMLLPPIGIFAVLAYHKAGNVDWPTAMLLAAGFAVGAYIGGRIVNAGLIREEHLRLMFLALLLYVAARMLFKIEPRVRAALETAALVVAFAGTYVGALLLARKWSKAPPYWAALYQEKLKAPVGQDYEI